MQRAGRRSACEPQIVHVALAALILSGLTVTTIVRKADALKVFDVRELVAPPPSEPPAQPGSAPKEQAAPAAPRSTPTGWPVQDRWPRADATKRQINKTGQPRR